MSGALHSWYSIGCWFRVAIICRLGVVEAAKHVTLPTLRTASGAVFLAALSDILFNKVNNLGLICRVSHENLTVSFGTQMSIFLREARNRQ